MGPLDAIGPEVWSEAAVSTTLVATFTVFTNEAVTSSGTLLCPTRVPAIEIENVRFGLAPIEPDGSVEKVKEPMPEAPGAKVASEESVSRLKRIVRSWDR